MYLAAEDLSYQKFGKLTALYRVQDYVSPSGNRKTRWMCLCDCGNYAIAQASQLKSGNTKSCGCRKIEAAKENAAKNVKHGEIHTRLYGIWAGIKARCYGPYMQDYKNYGGRGITMCDEWRYNYVAFRDWALSHGYRDDLTIDRIDVNGNYCPENCRWITVKEQCNNTRVNRYITIDGVTKTKTQWAEQYGMSQETLGYRLDHLGMDIEEALTAPVENNRYITYSGETKSLVEWADIINIPYHTLKARLNALHWPVEKAFETPVMSKPGSGNRKKVTYNGETLSKVEWSERTGIPADVITSRLGRGWSVEEALTTPVRAHRKKAG